MTSAQSGESGMTLVETLVASALSIVLLSAVVTLVITSVSDQPQVSAKAGNIQTVRWVLERLTREVRNGVSVDSATSSAVSFRSYVRRPTCGGTGTLTSGAAPTLCEVTYTCTGGVLRRVEADPGVYTGTGEQLVSGLSGCAAFTYSPSPTAATYIGINLILPNPSGSGNLTISDGSSLRNATLSN